MKPEINCGQISALLKSGYADNELDHAAREQVNRHLEECPACRRTKENLEAISLLLRNAPRANPPEDLWKHILAEIRPKRVPRISLSENISAAYLKYLFAKRNAFVLAAAAALVIAAVGFYFGNRPPDNGEPAPSLTALIGNDEMRAPDINFGSNIEKYFL